jgi:uncharacterized protein
MYVKAFGDHTYFDSFTRSFSSEILNSETLHSLSVDDLAILRRLNIPDTLNVIITVTTLCDLQCDYCFENHGSRASISHRKLEDVVRGLEGFIISKGIGRANVTIFGGEPMLNFGEILYLVDELNSFGDNNNVSFSYILTTNGLICDVASLVMLSERNVLSAQITFDGPEKIHNRRRRPRANLSNVSNPYLQALNNIRLYAEYFQSLSIKYNFDKENFWYYDVFLEDLDSVLPVGAKDRIHIVLEAIQRVPCNNYSEAFKNISIELADAYINLIKKSIMRSFKYSTRVFNTPCMHLSRHAVLIDHDGHCRSCISSFGVDEFLISDNIAHLGDDWSTLIC